MATAKNKINQPLKYHGGKFFLASKIIELFPKHKTYVEPYAGGLAVLLAKDPTGTSEVVNDIDSRLTNFWRVLQDPEAFRRFRRLVESIPFSEAEWNRSVKQVRGGADCDFVEAAHFFVVCRQSLSGRMQSFTGISKSRTRRGMNEQVSAWLTAIEGLPEVHSRLKRVLIKQEHALDTIQSMDGKNTLFYLDPPYLQSTRESPEVYRFEMSFDDHLALLDTCLACEGKIALSGYQNDLYKKKLKNWNLKEFRISNHASSAKRKPKVTECLWMNY